MSGNAKKNKHWKPFLSEKEALITYNQWLHRSSGKTGIPVTCNLPRIIRVRQYSLAPVAVQRANKQRQRANKRERWEDEKARHQHTRMRTSNWELIISISITSTRYRVNTLEILFSGCNWNSNGQLTEDYLHDRGPNCLYYFVLWVETISTKLYNRSIRP